MPTAPLGYSFDTTSSQSASGTGYHFDSVGFRGLDGSVVSAWTHAAGHCIDAAVGKQRQSFGRGPCLSTARLTP
ncbi:hypothetical protein MASR2M74_36130 [Paracoccaceae bacterium]